MPAKRKKMPAAGDKADKPRTRRTKPPADAKPGTRALRQLLAFFSHDATRVHSQDATLGQDGAAHAQKAIEYLAAGDAEQAAWWAVQAMDVYRRIEKLAQGFDHAADMQDLAERWKADTGPAVNRETARRKGKAREAADFRQRLDDAADKLAALLTSNPRMSYTAKVKKVAKDAGISERAFRKHMPQHLKARHD